MAHGTNSQLSIYPDPPAGIPSLADFTAQVRIPGGSYSNLFTYMAHKYSNPAQEDNLPTGFVMFDCSGTVQMQITYNAGTLTSAQVWPQAYGITPSINGNVITFSMTEPKNIVLNVNGNPLEALHIFANPMDTNVPTNGIPGVMYFGAGLHQYGNDSNITRSIVNAQQPMPGGSYAQVALDTVTVPSGTTAYLAPGAVVQAQFVTVGSNVGIRGRGLIDFSQWDGNFTEAYLTNTPQMAGGIYLNSGNNLTFEGVVVLDPPCLGLQTNPYGGSNLTVNNLKVFTCMGGGDDGIDFNNVTTALMENSFVSAVDDCSDTHDDSGVTYTNDVFSCDGCGPSGNGVFVSIAGNNRNYLAENCYVIYAVGAPIRFNAYKNVSQNITFTNIQLDRIYSASPITLYPYSCWLHGAGVLTNFTFNYVNWNTNFMAATLGGVTYNNLAEWSTISGCSPTNMVSGVSFNNCHLNGNLITNAASGDLSIGPYVTNVTFNGVAASTSALGVSPLLMPFGTGNYMICNQLMGEALCDDGTGKAVFETGTGTKYQWSLVNDDGYIRFVNAATGNSLNCSNNNGSAQTGNVSDSSADWMPISRGSIYFSGGGIYLGLENRLQAARYLNVRNNAPAVVTLSYGDPVTWYLVPVSAAPTGLSAAAGNGQVMLSWNPVSGATSYNVKRATSCGEETTIATVSPAVSQVVNFDVPGGAGSGYANYSGQGAYPDSGHNYWNPFVLNGTTAAGKCSDGATATLITLTDNTTASPNHGISVYGGGGTQATSAALEWPYAFANNYDTVWNTLNNVSAGNYTLYLYGMALPRFGGQALGDCVS